VYVPREGIFFLLDACTDVGKTGRRSLKEDFSSSDVRVSRLRVYCMFLEENMRKDLIHEDTKRWKT